jgi:hypothetical protein
VRVVELERITFLQSVVHIYYEWYLVNNRRTKHQTEERKGGREKGRSGERENTTQQE